MSGAAAVSDTRRESSSGQGRLDNDITRGSDTIMDVDIFWIACPFCTNYRKGEKNPSILWWVIQHLLWPTARWYLPYLIDKPQQLQSVLWVLSWGQIRWSLQGTKAMGKIQASQLYYTLPCPACLPTIKYIKHKIRPTIGGQKTMLRLFCRRGWHQWGWGRKIQ